MYLYLVLEARVGYPRLEHHQDNQYLNASSEVLELLDFGVLHAALMERDSLQAQRSAERCLSVLATVEKEWHLPGDVNEFS